MTSRCPHCGTPVEGDADSYCYHGCELAARLIEDRTRLYALQLICDHLRLLPERDPHDRLLWVGETMTGVVGTISTPPHYSSQWLASDG